MFFKPHAFFHVVSLVDPAKSGGIPSSPPPRCNFTKTMNLSLCVFLDPHFGAHESPDDWEVNEIQLAVFRMDHIVRYVHDLPSGLAGPILDFWISKDTFWKRAGKWKRIAKRTVHRVVHQAALTCEILVKASSESSSCIMAPQMLWAVCAK